MRQRRLIVSSGLALMFFAIGGSGNEPGAFIGPLNKVATIASTVPLNGDQNPYGVAIVPRTTG
jgi:hypothetical protein